MARRRPKQLVPPDAARMGRTRTGAGRKPNARGPGVWHVRDRRTTAAPRPRHPARRPPVARPYDPSALFRVMTGASLDRTEHDFRVIHFSVQQTTSTSSSRWTTAGPCPRGLQGLAGRCAWAINRVTPHRGRVWTDRYHARRLTTPREIRAAMVYVLQNFRKHLRAPAIIDPCSSGPWFEGWRAAIDRRGADTHRPPRSWLATQWLAPRGGAITSNQAPARRRR